MNQPVIRHIANLWSLVEYPSQKKEWSLERKLRAVRDAGFDGITTLPTLEHRRLAEKYGLMIVGYFASAKASEFPKLIRQNREAGAYHINVQLADEDTLTPEALNLTFQLMKESEKQGMECHVELHRDTCTETPEKMYALAEGYEKKAGKPLPITWDFSHVSVVKHLYPHNYAERMIVRPDLIRRAQLFHFRPFNGHHCQVPVTDGRGNLTPEVKDWIPFMEKVMACWLAGRQPAGREFFACPEMGPVAGGYNFACLPNSWEDAKILRKIIDQAWKKALRKR